LGKTTRLARMASSIRDPPSKGGRGKATEVTGKGEGEKGRRLTAFTNSKMDGRKPKRTKPSKKTLVAGEKRRSVEEKVSLRPREKLNKAAIAETKSRWGDEREQGEGLQKVITEKRKKFGGTGKGGCEEGRGTLCTSNEKKKELSKIDLKRGQGNGRRKTG